MRLSSEGVGVLGNTPYFNKDKLERRISKPSTKFPVFFTIKPQILNIFGKTG